MDIREDRRRGIFLVVVGVGALLLAGALIGNVTTAPGQRPRELVYPAGAYRLALVSGPVRAPATLTVYEDFRCPACAREEAALGPTVRGLEAAGELRTVHHLLASVDASRGGAGSLNAANAAACAQDAGAFARYRAVLFRYQPPESGDDYADKALLKRLAEAVPGLSGRRFDRCVEEGRHDAWVKRATAAYRGPVPALRLDGRLLDAHDLTPARLRHRVAAAVSGTARGDRLTGWGAGAER